jgi:hypothetical protein
MESVCHKGHLNSQQYTQHRLSGTVQHNNCTSAGHHGPCFTKISFSNTIYLLCDTQINASMHLDHSVLGWEYLPTIRCASLLRIDGLLVPYLRWQTLAVGDQHMLTASVQLPASCNEGPRSCLLAALSCRSQIDT